MVKTKVRNKNVFLFFKIPDHFLGSIWICLRCCCRRSNLSIKSITTIKWQIRKIINVTRDLSPLCQHWFPDLFLLFLFLLLLFCC
jgi:hypothetical protein